MKFLGALSLCIASSSLVVAIKDHRLARLPVQPTNAHLATRSESSILQKWFTQISDHDNPTKPPAGFNATFQQRYWIDTQYYKPGGPVIVIESGETSGADRIEYVETGIIRYLMEYLGGIGIILEHRYYGASHVSKDLSTASMALLNTKQALADNAYFAKNLYKYLPANMSHIRPDKTPFISYGGSYAGSKSAFLQVTHGDAYWASIASSAVIWAGESFWEYHEPARKHANRTCIRVIQTVADRYDNLVKTGGKPLEEFKKLFGVSGLNDADAGNTISYPVSNWQSKNWDTSIPGEDSWDKFCANITNGVKLYQENASALGPYDATQGIRNYAAYLKGFVDDYCLSGNSTLEECFDTDYMPQYTNVNLSNRGGQDWRIWSWQVCTEYGYYQHAAPAGHPTLISRTITLDYLRKTCGYFFGFPMSHHANTTEVNQYGSYSLVAPRLLYVDGNYDPWLYATAHSPYSPQRHKGRPNNYLIDVAWHHSDENGLGDISKEPKRIQDVHNYEIEIVRRWVKEFYAKNAGRPGKQRPL